MIRNILPLETNVKLTSYPYLSDYLSVLEGYNYNYSGIIFNNYIDLFYKPWKGQIRFVNQRYLQSNFEIEKFSFPLSDPLQFIFDNIDNNKYIIIVLKLNNVILKNGFQALNVYHDWLIYGYDTNKMKLYIAGYVRKNKVNSYQKFYISFSEFLSSVPQSDNITNYQTNIMYNHLFKIKEKYLPESIDYKIIKRNIKRYVNKYPPILFNRSIYKRLIMHIRFFSKSSFVPHNRSLLDIRDFKTIYEHTIIFYDLISLLSNNTELINQYEEVKNCAFSLVLLVTRYRNDIDLARRISIQKNAIKKIRMIDKNEKLILKRLLKDM